MIPSIFAFLPISENFMAAISWFMRTGSNISLISASQTISMQFFPAPQKTGNPPFFLHEKLQKIEKPPLIYLHANFSIKIRVLISPSFPVLSRDAEK